jgi:DNA (cytosine-5)-methyltransferase 1
MRVLSLFSGAGGLDLGLAVAGHEIVWANDDDPDCVNTYRRNLGDHIVLGDIRAISSAEMPSCDLVVGGFPCQGFSLANMRRTPDDERNVLYREFVRVVADKRPAFFLAENVKGILSLDRGTAIARIVADFAQLGYEVAYRLVNAADYGVPQTRMRVFIVGVRNDKAVAGVRFEYPRPTHRDPRKPATEANADLTPWVTVGEALAGLPPLGSPLVPNHVASSYKVVPRNFTGHRVTALDRPSPTILARGNGGGGVCAIPHPTEPRRMSVRESATVQTFPLDFAFEGRLNSMYRQIGNAVPPLLATSFGERFADIEGTLAAVA